MKALALQLYLKKANILIYSWEKTTGWLFLKTFFSCHVSYFKFEMFTGKCDVFLAWLFKCLQLETDVILLPHVHFVVLLLTHFQLMFHFYIPWKRQKTKQNEPFSHKCLISIPPENVRQPKVFWLFQEV